MTIAEYYRQANPHLLMYLPRNAQTILEIGCGAGSLAKAYKQENPHCHYRGIEMDEACAAEARNYMDEVHVGNVETLPEHSLNIAEESLDCLIYGDVLEHLYDPWSVIKQHRKWLKKDGVVLASIPNAQHWTMFYKLLHGKWNYDDQGLLDRGHIRFFTLDSIQAMFNAAHLSIIDAKTRTVENSEEDRKHFETAIAPMLNSYQIDHRAFYQKSSAYQYTLRAANQPLQQKPLFIQSMMLRPVGACNDVRIIEPFRMLNSVPGVYCQEKVSAMDLRPVHTANQEDRILIWHRPSLDISTENIEKIHTLRKRGYLIIIEFDDYPGIWDVFKRSNHFAFRAVHAVQTSTKPLLKHLRQFNPNTEIFPNQLAYTTPLLPLNDDAPITLFFGALNREEEHQYILPALQKAIEQFGDMLRFEVIHDKKFFAALPTSHKQFTPLCDYATYQNILRRSHICLMPLSDTPFNRMKSDLKFIEAASCGAVALASPTVYSDVIEDGKTGIIFDSPETFETKLFTLLQDKDYIKTIRHHAYNHITKERLLCLHYKKRLTWYRSLLSRLPKLDQQLTERTPELFA